MAPSSSSAGTTALPARGPVVALSGGVGGAKLALGLARALEPGQLTAVANTGDDFEHFGLHIAPDLDTLMYTLSGISNTETGWGRAGETWTFKEAMAAFGGATWFQLGDGDLATHVERSRRLRNGESLTAVTTHLATSLGLPTRLLPMSDDKVSTMVHTVEGVLPFQHYFVERRCQPVVLRFEFDGIEQARANPLFLDALAADDLQAVIICPSNPFISIDPILALPDVAAVLRACPAPVIAVSPIIAGNAVKGPTAKMLRELGVPVTAAAIARHYGELLDGYVLDAADRGYADQLTVPTLATQTLMQTMADRDNLARATLAFAAKLGRGA